MDLKSCFNASEDSFPLPPSIRKLYGPFGFPELSGTRRPHITSNFVMGLDGRASFHELPGRAGGRDVSRSREDRWLMDFLRAHHDAQLIGANTLREERGRGGRGLDFAIDDPQLRDYRAETLKFGPQKIIVLTASGNLDVTLRLFSSPRVEPWILTTISGAQLLREQFKMAGREGAIKILSVGDAAQVDLSAAVQLLRQEHGIRTLLCEGGPAVYGDLLKNNLIDEDFRTISLQVLGESTQPAFARPTAYGNVSYTPETAPWFNLISLHYAGPHHVFLRLRYHGPRKFPE